MNLVRTAASWLDYYDRNCWTRFTAKIVKKVAELPEDDTEPPLWARVDQTPADST